VERASAGEVNPCFTGLPQSLYKPGDSICGFFFWQFDASIHLMYNVATRIRSEWKEKYGSRNNGRRKFQIHLAHVIAEYAIRLDWNGTPETNPNGRPAWMRQKALIPCDCGECFFCKTGMTNGITHKTVTIPPPKHQVPEQCNATRKQVHEYTGYCCVCMKEAKDQYSGSLSGKARKQELRRHCGKTRKGCTQCQALVCDNHWSSFTHNKNDYK